jgi:hypothetical protein
MIIRTARPEDAEQLLHLRLQLDDETQFMLLAGSRGICKALAREECNRVACIDLGTNASKPENGMLRFEGPTLRKIRLLW